MNFQFFELVEFIEAPDDYPPILSQFFALVGELPLQSRDQLIPKICDTTLSTQGTPSHWGRIGSLFCFSSL